jgi:hypothetical protein
MLGAQGLWTGRDLYRATPAVTQGLGFSSFIQRTAPINRLLRHTRGFWGPNLTRILTGRRAMTMRTKCYMYYHVTLDGIRTLYSVTTTSYQTGLTYHSWIFCSQIQSWNILNLPGLMASNLSTAPCWWFSRLTGSTTSGLYRNRE